MEFPYLCLLVRGQTIRFGNHVRGRGSITHAGVRVRKPPWRRERSARDVRESLYSHAMLFQNGRIDSKIGRMVAGARGVRIEASGALVPERSAAPDPRAGFFAAP